MSWRSSLIQKMSRNPNFLSNQSKNYCTVLKNVFFHYFDDFRCHILAKKQHFFHLRAKINQFWQQIRIPWHFLDEKWPPVHFCTIKFFCQTCDLWNFSFKNWAAKVGGQWGQWRPTDNQNDHSGINFQPSLNRKPLYIKFYYISSVCHSQITLYT